jgi:hypothetical protein
VEVEAEEEAGNADDDIGAVMSAIVAHGNRRGTVVYGPRGVITGRGTVIVRRGARDIAGLGIISVGAGACGVVRRGRSGITLRIMDNIFRVGRSLSGRRRNPVRVGAILDLGELVSAANLRQREEKSGCEQAGDDTFHINIDAGRLKKVQKKARDGKFVPNPLILTPFRTGIFSKDERGLE